MSYGKNSANSLVDRKLTKIMVVRATDFRMLGPIRNESLHYVGARHAIVIPGLTKLYLKDRAGSQKITQLIEVGR